MSETRNHFNPEEKLQLVLDSYRTPNVQAFCRERNIDRSYLYQLRRDHEQASLELWRSRKVGRPKSEVPEDAQALKQALGEARDRIRTLETEMLGLRVQAEMGQLLADWVDRRERELRAKKKPSSWRPKRSI